MDMEPGDTWGDAHGGSDSSVWPNFVWSSQPATVDRRRANILLSMCIYIYTHIRNDHI